MYIICDNIDEITKQLENNEYRIIDFDSVEIFIDKDLNGDFQSFRNMLTFCKNKYKKGMYFKCASGSEKKHMVLGPIRFSDHFQGCISSEMGGLLYDSWTKNFAKIII